MTVSYETRVSNIGYVFEFRLFGDWGTLEHRKRPAVPTPVLDTN